MGKHERGRVSLGFQECGVEGWDLPETKPGWWEVAGVLLPQNSAAYGDYGGKGTHEAHCACQGSRRQTPSSGGREGNHHSAKSWARSGWSWQSGKQARARQKLKTGDVCDPT